MSKTAHCLIWIPLLLLALTVLAYVANFKSAPISSNPSNWGVFGDYLGGVLNPIIAFATLCATVYLALVASKFDQARRLENSRPIALIRCADYENRIIVFIENAGVGPLEIIKISIIQNGVPKNTENLIELMPETPNGIYWTFFTLAGPQPIIYPNTQSRLLQLDGKLADETYCAYRNEVRERLNAIEIKIEYKDIYGGVKEPTVRKLSEVFGRHFAPIGLDAHS